MPTRTEAIHKINDLIGDIKVAMLTTVDINGCLQSRPMITQEHDFDGDLWFFAESSSDKVNQIHNHSAVNVTYVNGGSFVSIAGNARIVTDVDRKKDLWHAPLKIWFENGPESPEVVLIRVEARSAEYWESPPGGIIGKTVAMVKVLLSGEPEAAGESKAINL